MSDRAVALPPIVFGTDGWRARVGEEYTYDNVRRCAQGVAQYVRDQGASAKGVVDRVRPPVLVGVLRAGRCRSAARP